MSDTPITDREELCTTDYILPQFVVTSDICRELERENQQLKQTVLATLSQRGQKELIVAWDRVKELERDNNELRTELEAQAVVNGKGGEREAKLLAEVATLKSDRVDNLAQIYKLGVENDQLRLELENVKQDRERMMFRHDEQLDEVCEERDKLKAENAALREDKERLDWLIKNQIGVAYGAVSFEAFDKITRVAIDAARKEQP